MLHRLKCDIGVSIHAPRVGCDSFAVIVVIIKLFSFNSRTPCGVRPYTAKTFKDLFARFNSRTPCGVRLRQINDFRHGKEFQFTHPVWGATPSGSFAKPSTTFQFTHPVWGATSERSTTSAPPARVSIHAPRVGCDSTIALHSSQIQLFQFTHPVWGATDM